MTGTVTPGQTPDLAAYDVILVNTSGGKDSQVAMHVIVAAAKAAGVLEAVVAVHADLGEMEWEGTRELAEAQATFYGIPFLAVRRERDGVAQTLLEQVEERGMWPDAARRYCTSDHKRAPIRKVMTASATGVREAGVTGRPVRILNVMGLRAQESKARAMKAAYRFDDSASNGRRHVDEWLPVHAWTEEQVWATIRESGAPSHPAYDAGMPRLSCRFCVLASKSALVLSAQLNPDMAARYAEVEARIGHSFRQGLSMADVIAEAARAPRAERAEGWAA